MDKYFVVDLVQLVCVKLKTNVVAQCDKLMSENVAYILRIIVFESAF